MPSRAPRQCTLRARVVLLRQSDQEPEVLLTYHRHPERAFWCFPGGVAEQGESLAEAAVRETREETGLRVHLTGLCYLQDRPAAGAVDVFFLANQLAGEAALGTDPDRPAGAPPVLTEVRWVPVSELPGLTVLPAPLAASLLAGHPAWAPLPLPQ